MKIFHSIFLILLVLAFSCKDGYIDEIKPVDPGPDETAPEVEIVFPTEGIEIILPEARNSVNIKFEVEDDIEIASVKLLIDGNEVATYSEFTDYRRVARTYVYDEPTDGNHKVTVEAVDAAGKTTVNEVNFAKGSSYEGEVFYMPFEDDMMEKVSGTAATEVGSPSFAAGKIGQAYAGAADSYLTFPTDDLKNNAFSAIFWMKLNADPDRAGILVMGPPDEGNPNFPDTQNLRTNGFRFFREDAGGMQRVKLNAGDGAADSWFDGGDAADVDPMRGEWVHYAFTISETECIVYINGSVVSQGTFSGIDWTGCDILSIMSGAPRFTEWGHGADQSLLDELRIFNKALTEQEIQTIIAAEL